MDIDDLLNEINKATSTKTTNKKVILFNLRRRKELKIKKNLSLIQIV
jgi:hypothetical protein